MIDGEAALLNFLSATEMRGPRGPGEDLETMSLQCARTFGAVPNNFIEGILLPETGPT